MTAAAKKKLSARETRFVDLYCVSLNATASARDAGFSPRSPDSAGAKLLARPHVRAAVDARLAKSTAKAQLTAERIDQEIAALAFSDLRKLFNRDGTIKPMSEWPNETASAVASIENEEIHGRKKRGKSSALVRLVKLKAWSKTEALTLAARRLKLLTDKVEVTPGGSLVDLVMQVHGLAPVKAPAADE